MKQTFTFKENMTKVKKGVYKGDKTGVVFDLNGAKKPREVDTQQLKELAIYLDGLNQGKGHILPLGTEHISNLWYAIHYLNNYVK